MTKRRLVLYQVAAKQRQCVRAVYLLLTFFPVQSSFDHYSSSGLYIKKKYCTTVSSQAKVRYNQANILLVVYQYIILHSFVLSLSFGQFEVNVTLTLRDYF